MGNNFGELKVNYNVSKCMVGTGKGVPRVRYAEQNSAELDEKTIGISEHGSVYGGEGAFDGRAKKSSPKNCKSCSGKGVVANLPVGML